VLLGIGVRFDDRIIGKADHFAPNARVIHVDIDPAEIGKNVHTELPIVGDCRQVLEELTRLVKKPDTQAWTSRLQELKKKLNCVEKFGNIEVKTPLPKLPFSSDHGDMGLSMREIIRELNHQTHGNCILVTDVGQHQMIASQEFQFINPHSHLTSGGSGSMGYSLPASMGAKVACPEKEVWCVCGDGGIQMNLQELVTLAQDRIGVKIAILNNGFLGMVRQWQELFFEKNYSQVKLFNPDFVKLAEACGITAFRAKTAQDMKDVIAKMRSTDGPVLCDFVVAMEENVFPMVPSGKSLSDTITGL
jgi:acetolactate synthase-1/2/3 large subunit